MGEIEIGSNLLVIASLIVNAVLVPYVLHLNKKCTHLQGKVDG